MLSRPDGSLVDFSNYRGDATELLEEESAEGVYRLEIVARSDVPSLDLSIAATDPLATFEGAEANIEATRDDRLLIGTILDDFGYFAGSEVEIAVSPETVRSFMALQDATGEPVTGMLMESELLAALQTGL